MECVVKAATDVLNHHDESMHARHKRKIAREDLNMSELVVSLLRRARDPVYRSWLQAATPEDLSALGLKRGQQAVLLSNLLLTSPFNPQDLPDWDDRYGAAFAWVDNRELPIPWTPFTKPVQKAKIALVTTAGIYRYDDQPFAVRDEERGDPTYRVIPLETPLDGLCVKHHLVLVQPRKDGDTGHLFPLRAVRQLYEDGMIGEPAATHYSFMGYIPYTQPLVEQTAPAVAQRLRAERVDAVILTPA